MKELRDRVAVITGAASGIGYGLAEVFAAEGMRLVLADIDEGRLNSAAAKLSEQGATVLAMAIDVAQPERVDELASRTLARFGAVHVLCNNAGVSASLRTIWEAPLADWHWIMGVNVMGVVHGLRSFMPILLEQPEAHVVNTASILGLVTSSEGGGAYAASKHAVVALTEALQVQLDRAGAAHVGVSCLCPGPVDSQIVANSAAQRPGAGFRAVAVRADHRKRVQALAGRRGHAAAARRRARA